MLSNKKIIMVLMVVAVIMVFAFRKDDRNYLLGTYKITNFENTNIDLDDCKVDVTRNGKVTFYNEEVTLFEAFITKYKKDSIKLAIKDKDKYSNQIFNNSKDVFSVLYEENNNNIEFKYNNQSITFELDK